MGLPHSFCRLRWEGSRGLERAEDEEMDERAEEVDAVVEERGRVVGVVFSRGGRGTDSTIFWALMKAVRR